MQGLSETETGAYLQKRRRSRLQTRVILRPGRRADLATGPTRLQMASRLAGRDADVKRSRAHQLDLIFEGVRHRGPQDRRPSFEKNRVAGMDQARREPIPWRTPCGVFQSQGLTHRDQTLGLGQEAEKAPWRERSSQAAGFLVDRDLCDPRCRPVVPPDRPLFRAHETERCSGSQTHAASRRQDVPYPQAAWVRAVSAARSRHGDLGPPTGRLDPSDDPRQSGHLRTIGSSAVQELWRSDFL
jgi:hypothetical protein